MGIFDLCPIPTPIEVHKTEEIDVSHYPISNADLLIIESTLREGWTIDSIAYNPTLDHRKVEVHFEHPNKGSFKKIFFK